MAASSKSLNKLFNHINETQKSINNETKLLHFIIRNKRNYHRARIRFRHLVEVSRKHKRIASKWKSFSASIQNNISKNSIDSKVQSIISYIDNVGRDTKSFADIIIKCVGSFINEYILSGHDINFCYLTIGILGRLYSLYSSRTSQMAQTRRALFLFEHKTKAVNYSVIYWNDLNLFNWPKQMIDCDICASAKDKIYQRNSTNLNQFDEDTLSSIDAKEMEGIIKQIYCDNYGFAKCVNSTDQETNQIDKKPNVKSKKHKSGNDRNKVIGTKRKIENVAMPQRKRPKRQKRIGSTFDLMPKSESNTKKARTRRTAEKQSKETVRDEIDDIFGDLDL